MWSGPRNISTAMMRSWGNRKDTVVVDEPFYAFYLKATGKNHPGANEVIAHGETDWRKIVANVSRSNSARKHKYFPKTDDPSSPAGSGSGLVRRNHKLLSHSRSGGSHLLIYKEERRSDALKILASSNNSKFSGGSAIKRIECPSGGRCRETFCEIRSERCDSFAK